MITLTELQLEALLEHVRYVNGAVAHVRPLRPDGTVEADVFDEDDRYVSVATVTTLGTLRDRVPATAPARTVA